MENTIGAIDLDNGEVTYCSVLEAFKYFRINSKQKEIIKMKNRVVDYHFRDYRLPQETSGIGKLYHKKKDKYFIFKVKNINNYLTRSSRLLKAHSHHDINLQKLYDNSVLDDFSFEFTEVLDEIERDNIYNTLIIKLYENNMLVNDFTIDKCELCEKTSIHHQIITSNKFGETRKFCKVHYYQVDEKGQFKRKKSWKNEIVCHDDFCEVLLYDKNQNVTGRTTISKEHLDVIKEYKWYKKDYPNRYTDYVMAVAKDGKTIRMHNLIASITLGEKTEGVTVDHINRDGLDNRKENLRYLDQTLQNFNQRIRTDNSSGVTGVFFSNQGYWTATFKYKKIRLLKTFNKKEDAISKRRYWDSLLESGNLEELMKEGGYK